MSNWTLIFLIAIPIVVLIAQLLVLLRHYHLDIKLDEVHDAVNSNLSRTQAELVTALTRVTNLETQVAQMRETITILKAKLNIESFDEQPGKQD